jgi:queuosine precursor transporter
MKNKVITLNEQLIYKAEPSFKGQSVLFMLAVTFLIISMLFAYRIVQFGPLLAPGGVFIFAFIYFIADVVSEVYGYASAKLMIWSNFICIFIFNIVCHLLLKLPAPLNATYVGAYQIVFGNSFYLMVGFSLSFLISDFVNAYIISRSKVLLNGKHFWLRSISSSTIGEIIFSVVATMVIYTKALSLPNLPREFLGALLIKVVCATILAYPGMFLVAFLKKIEQIDVYDHPVKFNPKLLSEDQ